MTALLEYLDLTALLEYIDLLNRYSGGLSRYRWSPAPSGPAGPTSALQAVRPDHVKLRQVVRPASIGPPNETAV